MPKYESGPSRTRPEDPDRLSPAAETARTRIDVEQRLGRLAVDRVKREEREARVGREAGRMATERTVERPREDRSR